MERVCFLVVWFLHLMLCFSLIPGLIKIRKRMHAVGVVVKFSEA